MPITVNGETYYTETEAREKFSTAPNNTTVFYTTAELAKRWGTTAQHLHYRRSVYGTDSLPKGFKLGKTWLYKLSDIEAFETAHTN